MTKYAALIAALFVLSACTDNESTPWSRLESAAPKPKAVTNTPDAAVKSWWQARDARQSFDSVVCAETRELYRPTDQTLLSLANNRITAAIADPDMCLPTTYAREITKVDIQSDTRALVQAQVYNSTPPSNGYILDPDEKKKKERGIRLQYLLERSDTHQPWKISQIYSADRYCFQPVVDGWCPVHEDPAGNANAYVWEISQ